MQRADFRATPGGFLQRLRSILSDLDAAARPLPARKTFEAEGEILQHVLTKSLRIRNEAIKSLCSSVRRFRDATIKEECKSDYPQALRQYAKARQISNGPESSSRTERV